MRSAVAIVYSTRYLPPNRSHCARGGDVAVPCAPRTRGANVVSARFRLHDRILDSQRQTAHARHGTRTVMRTTAPSVALGPEAVPACAVRPLRTQTALTPHVSRLSQKADRE